jgi:hypothetical protein
LPHLMSHFDRDLDRLEEALGGGWTATQATRGNNPYFNAPISPRDHYASCQLYLDDAVQGDMASDPIKVDERDRAAVGIGGNFRRNIGIGTRWIRHLRICD